MKPFVRGAKNDAVDAEAIFEAISRPTIGFVPLKTLLVQQDLRALHRIRERLVGQRTVLINQARGLLAEYGIVLPNGPGRLGADGPGVVASAPLSDLARELFTVLFDQLRGLEARVAAVVERPVRSVARTLRAAG